MLKRSIKGMIWLKAITANADCTYVGTVDTKTYCIPDKDFPTHRRWDCREHGHTPGFLPVPDFVETRIAPLPAGVYRVTIPSDDGTHWTTELLWIVVSMDEEGDLKKGKTIGKVEDARPVHQELPRNAPYEDGSRSR